MSDVLVKLLRGRCNCNMPSSPCATEDDCRFDFRVADRIEELEAKLAKAMGALDEAWFMLTVPHLDYDPEPEEPGLRRIKTALEELKEQK